MCPVVVIRKIHLYHQNTNISLLVIITCNLNTFILHNSQLNLLYLRYN